MSLNLPLKNRSEIYPVCDLCYSRKVGCDKLDPCGKCQDAGVICTRHRDPRRVKKTKARHETRQGAMINTSQLQSNSPQIASESRISVSEPLPKIKDGPKAKITSGNRLESNFYQQHFSAVDPIISLIPLHEAQVIIRHELEGLTVDKRQILESALRIANQLSKSSVDPAQGGNNNNLSEEEPRVPSTELLTWMLKETKGETFAPFTADHFRYISEPTMREMGLSFLSNAKSPYDSSVSIACLNMIAYKFITSVINTECDSDRNHVLRHSAQEYRSVASSAIRRIPIITTPSIALLQAIISGIFLHQESGDIAFCWELTKTACRTCIEIGLDTIIGTREDVSEEAYYCFIWCYIFDKNYSFKLARSKCLLTVDLVNNICDLSLHHHTMSEALKIHLKLARIQALIIPFLNTSLLERTRGAVSSFDCIREQLLLQMRHTRAELDQITSHYPLWKGLDAQDEISILQFAYHSIMTTIFHLFRKSVALSLDTRSPYLHTARQGLSALVSVCHSAERKNDTALLHRSLLVYPMNAFFVLFCRVVTTSDTSDLSLLKTAVDCLGRSESKSRPITQLRGIFQRFVSLGEGSSNGEIITIPTTQDLRVQPEPNIPQWYRTVGSFSSTWSITNPALSQSALTATQGHFQIQIPGSDILLPWDDPFSSFTDGSGL